MEVIREAVGGDPVQRHLRDGLLTLSALALGFHPDDLRQELDIVLTQRNIGVPGLAPFGRFLVVNEGFLRHGTLVVDPRAVVAQQNVFRVKAFLEAFFQLPEVVIIPVGVIDDDLPVFIDAGENDEVLGIGEDGVVVHQHDGDLPLLQRLVDNVPVRCLLTGKLKRLVAVFQPGNVIDRPSAEIVRQLVGGVFMVGQVACHHGQRNDAASAGRNGTAAVHGVGVVVLEILRNGGNDLLFFALGLRRDFLSGGLRSCFLGNCGSRLLDGRRRFRRGLHLRGDVQVLQHESAILVLRHVGINLTEPVFKPAVGNGEASFLSCYVPAVKNKSVRGLLRGILPQTRHLRLIRHGVGRDPDITGNRVFRNARTYHFANRRGGGRESGDAAKKRQRKQNRSQPPAISMYAHSFAPLSVKSVPCPRAAGYGCVYKHGYSIKHFLSKVKICRRRETVLPKRIFQEARSVYFLFRLWDIHRAEQPSSAPSVFMMTSSTSHLPRL